MRKEEGGGASSQPAVSSSQNPTEKTTKSSPNEARKLEEESSSFETPQTTPQKGDEPIQETDKKPAAKSDYSSAESSSPDAPQYDHSTGDIPVIAVSSSKGPAAFFSLARKMLVTNEYCILSALEGAIVFAIDTAQLLERSKLANIVRVNTEHVKVKPKQPKQPKNPKSPQKQPQQSSLTTPPSTFTASSQSAHEGAGAESPDTQRRAAASPSDRGMRRARIIITMQQTEQYRQWLLENPRETVASGDGGEGDF